jgi:hypothetical protein
MPLVKPIPFLIFCVIVTRIALADTATFFSVTDTTISENNGASTTGVSDTMIVGHLDPGHANVPSRGLLRFDLSSLPSGVIVTSATVELTVTAAANPILHQHFLHRVLLGWLENSATWTTSGTTPWENTGGDYEQVGDASVNITGGATYTLASTAGLVGTVQLWATNAASNFGWLLRSSAEDDGRNARRFATREANLNRPKLIVGYTLPPPSVTLVNPRVVGTNFHFEFAALPGTSYKVQYKPVVDGEDWTELSAHPAPGAPTVIPVQDALTSTNRFYRIISP